MAYTLTVISGMKEGGTHRLNPLVRRNICILQSMDLTIEKVKEFAKEAHDGQSRKYTPEPYIVHPVRVMELCKEHTSSVPVLCAALLHDVLEDTAVTKEELKHFLLSVINEKDAMMTLKLVVELTDVYVKEDYPQWNRKTRKKKEADRIAETSAGAQTIKYADIIDNCKEIVQYDQEFGPKFLRECKLLLQRIPKGNPQLYQQAKDLVEKELADWKLQKHNL
jgi:guanosine-3',5'-bis(diphosphate) 3'-pyrophosphohydrolase